MKLQVKRINKTLPLPKYHTVGSAAFDLYARVNTIIPPFKPTIIPLNLIVKVPINHFLMLTCRSSLPMKKNLFVANSVGIIDQDYHGDNDEIGLQVINFSKNKVQIKKGDRIAQALLVKITKASLFAEKKVLSTKSRGGWGSTDKK